MSDELLLSELCSICYTNKPKYRCPRCKTQSCSLPCYKRHQQRASCNGKRDPAEYLKKRDLATPAGIDRDYNYLKGVELSIDQAARETSDRGIGDGDTSKPLSKNTFHSSKLVQYLTANRIHVHRAPKGMSRQRQNKTRESKRQNIMWTVEWIDADDHRETRHDCSASSTLAELYDLLQTEKRNAKKRQHGSEESAVTAQKKHKTRERKPMSDSKDCKAGQVNENSATQKTPDDTTPTQSSESNEQNTPSHKLTEPPTEATSDDASESHIEGDLQSNSETEPHFYLLRPETASGSRVLIPLPSDRTLTQSLQDRTVLEFPTIYVLPHHPSQLLAPFMLEDTYLSMRVREEEQLQEALHKTKQHDTLPSARQHPNNTSQSVDPQKILDMLKRDVTR